MSEAKSVSIGTTYTCALCQGQFFSDRSDEEAMAEAKARDVLPMEDHMEGEGVIICDDCFQKGVESFGTSELPKVPTGD